MKKMIPFILLFITCILSSACGGSSSKTSQTTSDANIPESTNSGGSNTSSTKETLEVFTAETGPLEKVLTSTCTIQDGNQYKMYRLSKGNIDVMLSTDGLTFTGSQSTGIKSSQGTFEDFIRNPSVVKLTSGTYLMIYEGMDAQQNPKLFRATSNDGLSFTKYQGPLTDGGILEPNTEENNFMSVPDMVEVNGTIHLYYVANQKRIFHATSTDEGINWVRLGEIELKNVDTTDKTVDPDILVLPDGTFQIFYAYSEATTTAFGAKGVHSATGSDGHSFTHYGQNLDNPAENTGGFTLDPDIIQVIGTTNTYRMYYGYSTSPQNNIDLYSATFTIP